MKTKFNFNSQEVLEFPSVFPPAIEKFAHSAAKSLNCNLDFLCIPILIAVSIAVGSKTKIQIKKGWRESTILFAMIIGEPGCKKTPAIIKAIDPILSLQKLFLENYKQFIEDNPDEGPPKIESIITTDTTVEALAELMYNNPHGIMAYKDEGIGFFKGMGQYKSGGGDDMEKYLSIWSQTVLVINRKGKPPIQVNTPFLSFIGGIQVDLLESLSEMKDNGFIDRFLFSFPKALPAKHTDYELEDEIKNEYESIITFIYNSQIKSENRNLSFSEEAKKRWNEWHTEFCNDMNDESLPYYFKNVLSKLEGYTARFALILEYLNCAELGFDAHQVNVGSLDSAIKLTEYFISNIAKVRNSFGSSVLDKKIDKVITWLKKQNGGSTNSRRVYTNGVAGIKKSEDAYDIFMEMRSRGLGQMHMQGDGLGGTKKSFVFILDKKYTNNQNQTSNG